MKLLNRENTSTCILEYNWKSIVRIPFRHLVVTSCFLNVHKQKQFCLSGCWFRIFPVLLNVLLSLPTSEGSSFNPQATTRPWRPSMRTRERFFPPAVMVLLLRARPMPGEQRSTTACTPRWRWEGRLHFTQLPSFSSYHPVTVCFDTRGTDHPPCRLHVPVHPLLRGADHGAVETGSPPQTHPHLLPSTCGRGLLQRWESASFE